MITYLKDQPAPQEGAVYFFDSNVWIYILDPPTSPTARGKQYLDFFDAIVTLSDNPKCKKKPSIYINILVLTELVNALLRRYMDAYNDSGGSDYNFKEYRATQDYQRNLARIVSDLQGYLPYIQNEHSIDLDPVSHLALMPHNSDYNDFIYKRLALDLNMIVVTHDGDFGSGDGIQIITGNNHLR